MCSAIGPFHSGIGSRLHALFAPFGIGRWIIRSRFPARLNDHSEPVTDPALVKLRADFYKERHPASDDVFLLIEVADSSVKVDQGKKLVADAKAGIPDYWIVNLKAKLVEVYRRPLPIGEYSDVSRFQAGDTIAPAAFPDAQIAVADRF